MINFKKGFTVIELLIVIAVLGIILSIVLPQFSKIKENQVIKNTIGAEIVTPVFTLKDS